MSLDPPTDRRRRRTHTAVLDAAEVLFERNGYRGTSVDSLAEAADVALSSIYANFSGGKTDVYAALAFRVALEHEKCMSEAIGMSTATPLLAGFDAYVAFHRDRPLAFRLLGLVDVDEDESGLVGDARSRIDKILVGIVHDLVASTGLRDVAEKIVLLGWASINGILSLHHRGSVTASSVVALIEMARADAARRLEELNCA